LEKLFYEEKFHSLKISRGYRFKNCECVKSNISCFVFENVRGERGKQEGTKEMSAKKKFRREKARERTELLYVTGREGGRAARYSYLYILNIDGVICHQQKLVP
jgi:hypothetical protein